MNCQVSLLKCVEEREYIINFRNTTYILNYLFSSYCEDYSICVLNAVSHIVFSRRVLHDYMPTQKQFGFSLPGETSTSAEWIIQMN